MHHFPHHFSLLLPQVQSWIEGWLSAGGPIVIFITTLFEGIPPLGLLAPSHTVVFFGAFLASIGTLSFDYVPIAALGGMMLGDILGYFL
ncbi:MAG: hypothetical protein KGJ35_03835 [Patescibacteria group bacterium]|nr:hypothetical protein [Patescibacteria group bacterium]